MTTQLPGATGFGGQADLPADLGATFDHVAIAAPRIRDLLPLWRDTLGGQFALGADSAQTGWRTVRLLLGGVMCVELIEPLQGSAFLDGFFRRNPAGGVHHVTFLVDDVQAAFDRLSAGGYQPFGADEKWFQLFVHPRNAGGVLLQLMRRQPDAPPVSRPAMTIDDVLAGRGLFGTGLSSP
jgi:methylmalonyl-CoA/ethylmalonyl-CoA epimerase